MSHSLGQVLVQQGVLTAEGLAQAEQVQAQRGLSLGQTLVDLQLASEAQIVQAVATTIGLPFVDVSPGSVDPVAAGLMPRDTARELLALPVQFGEGNTVLVALADPGNQAALERVTAITGMQAHPALAVRDALAVAIEHLADATDSGGSAGAPPAAGGLMSRAPRSSPAAQPPGYDGAAAPTLNGNGNGNANGNGNGHANGNGTAGLSLSAAEEAVQQVLAQQPAAQPALASPARDESAGLPTRAPAQQPSAKVEETHNAKLAYEEELVFDLDLALQELIKRGGSDLHMTSGIPPAVRVNGELEHLPDFPVLTPDMLRNSLYSMMTQKQREAFENDLELDISYSLPGQGRFRVNVFQQRESIGSVMRLIPFEIKPLEDLGVPAQIANFAFMHRGLVLVTGPTGSGKSTTLASMIDIINRERASHIMTVEDPIEFLHHHKRSVVNQRELGTDTHSFNAALKHVLRQDPDVILVGEMRDLETIQLAITAAETGHLVFGTLHTQDAPQTIDRVIDVFPPHQQEQVRVMLATALQGVVTQQLLKRSDGSGRAVACEVMIATSAIRNLIREGKTHQMYSSIQAGKGHGMVAMDQSLAELVSKGVVTYNHALERCASVPDFNRLCGRT